MQWCVVFFHFDKTIEVVPEHWVFDDDNTICHFPPVKGFRLYEIIKCGASPKEDWKVYDVKVLAEYDDFTYAQTQCEEARNGKKISSQKTNTVHGGNDEKVHRIRKPNTKFTEFMSINTDDEELNNSITFPTFKGYNPKDGKQTTADVVANKVAENSPAASYRKNDKALEPYTQSETSESSHHTELMDNICQIIKKLEDLDAKNEVFQRTVMRNQYALQHKLNDLEHAISESANIGNQNTGQVSDEESEHVLSIWKLFPLNCVQALEDVENSLVDQHLQQLLALKFSLVGGATAKDITRRILYLMLTNDMAKLYSFDGAKGKLKFKSLKLYQLLLASIRKNQKTHDATESDILPEVRQWLAQAKFRKQK